MKIATILGARPQFIKAATVSRAIMEYNSKHQSANVHMTETIIHTGQHFDANMSSIFFHELSIPEPDYNLRANETMPGGAMTGKMLTAIEEVLIAESPDMVLVYGDTNSTLAGALAAAKLHITVAHVEAGLRSFNKKMPEEINRVISDHISKLLFCPTQTAVTNLENEGIRSGVHQVGDVMYDAALFYARRSQERSTILKDQALKAKGYILATIHRSENTDTPFRLKAIFEALQSVAQEFPIVLPLHPRTKKQLNNLCPFFHTLYASNITFLEPVGYLDMVMLEQNARCIVTDSGGVQKEAFFHRVPCVTLREETEWVELIEFGWNRLASPDNSNIRSLVLEAAETHGQADSLFGNGDAAEKIVQICCQGN